MKRHFAPLRTILSPSPPVHSVQDDTLGEFDIGWRRRETQDGGADETGMMRDVEVIPISCKLSALLGDGGARVTSIAGSTRQAWYEDRRAFLADRPLQRGIAAVISHISPAESSNAHSLSWLCTAIFLVAFIVPLARDDSRTRSSPELPAPFRFPFLSRSVSDGAASRLSCWRKMAD